MTKQQEKADDGGKNTRGANLVNNAKAAGAVASGIVEAAAAQAISKVAESVNQAEVASEQKLAATAKGHFDVLKAQSEKAQTPEEREQIRSDSKQALGQILGHDTAKSRTRWEWNWGAISGIGAVCIAVSVGAVKLFRR